MRAARFEGVGHISVIDRERPQLVDSHDAIVRVVLSCVCGSDLWYYRGLSPRAEGTYVGHEFVGVVEQLGHDVTGLSVGEVVIAPFTFNCGTCAHCLHGATFACLNGGVWGRPGFDGALGDEVRVPLADATLVAVPGVAPDDPILPALLTLSDVMCTGHHAAVSARVSPGSTVAVVGDGAVGLSAIIAAKRLGATRIIALSRNPQRQALAREAGADEIVEARGEAAVERVRELTNGIGADAVLECVGSAESFTSALEMGRPLSLVGFVGVPHGVELPVSQMFRRNNGVVGGMAPARAYIPELLDDVREGRINPALVFDGEYSLETVAQAYSDMDERRVTKALVRL